MALRWMFCALLLAALPQAWAEVVIGQIAPLSGVLASTGRQMALGDGYKVDETLRLTRELVAPYSGGEPLRTPFNPWIFHVRAGYADEAEHMVKQLTAQGIRRVAVLYQNDAFGQAGLAGVEAALARRSQQLVAAAPYERNTAEVQAPLLPVVREFHQLMKRHAPEAEINYTNFEGARGSETLSRAGRRPASTAIEAHAPFHASPVAQSAAEQLK